MHPDVVDNLQRLVGRRIIESKIGIGSFLTFLFENRDGEDNRFDWYLWIQHVAWKIESESGMLCGNEFTDRVEAKKEVASLSGSRVTNIDCYGLCHDFTLHLDNGNHLKVFAYREMSCEDGYVSWDLFTTEKLVVSVGPGSLVNIANRELKE